MDKSAILDQFAIYREAKAATRREMLDTARVASVAKGAHYIMEGGQTDQIALVGEGHLRVFKTSDSGREITLYGIGPGEFCMLNLLCVLTGISAPASATVERPVQAVMLRGADFRRWIGNDAAVRTFVFGLLANSVAETMALVEEIAFKKMDVRLAEYLHARLPNGSTNGAKVEATHEMIAADLGSAREVISRLLKEFERQGAVALGRGQITLSDAGVLKALAQRG